MDETQIIIVVVVCVIIILLVLIYLLLRNKNSTDSSSQSEREWEDEYDDNDNDEKESKKSENFYNELAFLFPTLANVDEPLAVSQYLLETKSISAERLQDRFSNLHHVSNENGHICFDLDGSHFDFNTNSKEILIDDRVHVTSSASGVTFSENDKVLAVETHSENGEYVVDDYAISNAEGISTMVEEKETIAETKETEENIIDNEIVESDTSY